jgi:hypothetical protein
MPFDGEGFEGQVEADLAVLRACRASMSERGAWCQNSFWRPSTGASCAVGWVLRHRGLRPEEIQGGKFPERAIGFVERVFSWRFDGLSGSGDVLDELIDFNDKSSRKARVLRLFDLAIARLEVVDG